MMLRLCYYPIVVIVLTVIVTSATDFVHAQQQTHSRRKRAIDHVDENILQQIRSIRNEQEREKQRRDLFEIPFFRNNKKKNNDGDGDGDGSIGSRCEGEDDNEQQQPQQQQEEERRHGFAGFLQKYNNQDQQNQQHDQECKNGLQCESIITSRFITGGTKRCLPRRDCIQDGLQEFYENFDTDVYKQYILSIANITQNDIVQSRQLFRGNGDREWIHNSPTMQSLIRTMQLHPNEDLIKLNDLISRCSSSINFSNREVDDYNPVDDDDDADDADDADEDDDGDDGGQQHRRSMLRRGNQAGFFQHEFLFPSNATTTTTSNTTATTTDIAATLTNTNTAAATTTTTIIRNSTNETGTIPQATTMAPTTAPPPGDDKENNNRIFVGIHLELGVTVDGSISIFWPIDVNDDGDDDDDDDGGDDNNNSTILQEPYIRGCVGAETGTGIELSFIALYSFSDDDPIKDIACKSVLLDIDLATGIGGGTGLGICYDTNPGSLYWEITAGIGLGFGVGASVCGVLSPENN